MFDNWWVCVPGKSHPIFSWLYIYGDYCSGEVFAVRMEKGGQIMGESRRLLSTQARISSFGEDELGELYLVDHQGAVYRIEPIQK